MCVNFEIDTPEEDHVISFKDSVVLGNVQQPLFCLGKLMKRGWVPVCDEHDLWYMQKGEAWFPVHWSRNSLATYMRISRLEEAIDREARKEMITELERPSLSQNCKLKVSRSWQQCEWLLRLIERWPCILRPQGGV